MPGGGQTSEAGADDDDGGLVGLGRDPLFDTGGDAEVDVAMGDDEGVGGVQEVVAMGWNGAQKGLFGEAMEDVVAPPGEDVVADEDVVHLLDAPDSRDDVGVDLLFGQGVGGEAG